MCLDSKYPINGFDDNKCKPKWTSTTGFQFD